MVWTKRYLSDRQRADMLLVRRYSEFGLLDQELQNRFPKRMYKIDKLPSKSLFGSMSPSRILERQKALDAYLRQLLREDSFVGSPELREFLEIPIEAALDSDDASCDSAGRDSSDSQASAGAASLAATVRAYEQQPLTPGSARVAKWQAESEATAIKQQLHQAHLQYQIHQKHQHHLALIIKG